VLFGLVFLGVIALLALANIRGARSELVPTTAAPEAAKK
jgi:hypothetical protein